MNSLARLHPAAPFIRRRYIPVAPLHQCSPQEPCRKQGQHGFEDLVQPNFIEFSQQPSSDPAADDDTNGADRDGVDVAADVKSVQTERKDLRAVRQNLRRCRGRDKRGMRRGDSFEER